jgi:hypothetical protein
LLVESGTLELVLTDSLTSLYCHSVPHSQTHFQQLFLMNGDYKSGFNKAAEGVAVP